MSPLRFEIMESHPIFHSKSAQLPPYFANVLEDRWHMHRMLLKSSYHRYHPAIFRDCMNYLFEKFQEIDRICIITDPIVHDHFRNLRCWNDLIAQKKGTLVTSTVNPSRVC